MLVGCGCGCGVVQQYKTTEKLMGGNELLFCCVKKKK